jgi:hypothetical protein
VTVSDPHTARAWLEEIREAEEKIGKGPTGTNLHKSEDWEGCAPCRETARLVAIRAGRTRNADVGPEFCRCLILK